MADRRRETPNPDRPRLARRAEDKLLPMDRASAEAYTLIESGLAKLDDLIAQGGGVVTESLDTVGDSMVHQIAVASIAPRVPPGGDDDKR